MIKFILFILVAFFLLSMLLGSSMVRLLMRALFGGRRKSQQRNQHSTQEPATQNDRINSYKKKEFETSAAEDVEFEEIKEEKK